MTELLPCPFCGGVAELKEHDDFYAVCHLGCDSCGTIETWWYSTEAEAIEAWNTRAAYENEGFFYLPKPNGGLYDTRLESTKIATEEDGQSIRTTGQLATRLRVHDEVAKAWANSIGKAVMERVCEVFKPERTCKPVERDGVMRCSECDYPLGIMSVPAFCAGCGAKVVE